MNHKCRTVNRLPQSARSLAALLLLAAVPGAQSLDDPRLMVETWASGLDRVASFAFIGDGEVLAFEKNTGRVVRLVDGALAGPVLDLDVAVTFSRGGLGIAVARTSR